MFAKKLEDLALHLRSFGPKLNQVTSSLDPMKVSLQECERPWLPTREMGISLSAVPCTISVGTTICSRGSSVNVRSC